MGENVRLASDIRISPEECRLKEVKATGNKLR
jgi:hypothetical protein